jgi:hypothetical protein
MTSATTGLTIDQVIALENGRLTALEDDVVAQVQANLIQCETGNWIQDDDVIFGPYAGFVRIAQALGTGPRAAPLWEGRIEPLVGPVEQILGRNLHKGAPLFNTGLACFVSGNLDQAAQYIDAAGEEDERRGVGDARDLIRGTGFSEQLLVQPLHTWVNANLAADYQSATGRSLTIGEFKDLLAGLSANPAETILALFALWRLIKQDPGPQTYSAGFHRLRAYADLLVAFESGLRSWQGSVGGQLHKRAEALTDLHAPMRAEFDAIHISYNGKDRELTASVNQLIDDEISRFDAAGGTTARIVTAVYASYRMRNSVMHVLDDQLSVFSNRAKLQRLVGFALIALFASWQGRTGNLSSF